MFEVHPVTGAPEDVGIDPFADVLDLSHVCREHWETGTTPTRSGMVTITGHCICLRVVSSATDSIL